MGESEAGFANQSHFTRTFHRLIGVPPAQFRRQTRPVQAPFCGMIG